VEEMNKFQPMKELVCADCGAKFFGLHHLYCDACRKMRRSKRKVLKKVCPICHKERRMYEKQVICRLCSIDRDRREKYERLTIAEAAARIKARRVGGKLQKIEQCPNFDATSMTCTTCVPGSWKFKGCGGNK
jgi:hypothetical protein